MAAGASPPPSSRDATLPPPFVPATTGVTRLNPDFLQLWVENATGGG